MERAARWFNPDRGNRQGAAHLGNSEYALKVSARLIFGSHGQSLQLSVYHCTMGHGRSPRRNSEEDFALRPAAIINARDSNGRRDAVALMVLGDTAGRRSW